MKLGSLSTWPLASLLVCVLASEPATFPPSLDSFTSFNSPSMLNGLITSVRKPRNDDNMMNLLSSSNKKTNNSSSSSSSSDSDSDSDGDGDSKYKSKGSPKTSNAGMITDPNGDVYKGRCIPCVSESRVPRQQSSKCCRIEATDDSAAKSLPCAGKGSQRVCPTIMKDTMPINPNSPKALSCDKSKEEKCCDKCKS